MRETEFLFIKITQRKENAMDDSYGKIEIERKNYGFIYVRLSAYRY